MEIKKLDRDKATQEVKKKFVPPSKKKALLKKEKIRPEDEELKKLGTAKILVYSILMIVVAVGSTTYNYFAYQKAHRPLITGQENNVEQASIEFYELCDDIEFYKEENGEYPESIDDLSYSKNLQYFRTSADAFRLIYNDSETNLTYDSTSDFDELR